MSHTPGPWSIDKYDAIVHSEGERVVVNGVQWTQTSDPALREQYKANQRLVAAAPDLLAALKDMVDIFDGYQGAQWKYAKSVIAKAEGR